jgi:hypothetical protein
LTTSIYPLIGLAGVLTMSGCAAVPVLNMANSLLKPAQPAQTLTATAATPPAAMPSPDIFSALAQHLGITQPTAQGTKTATTQTAATQTAATQTATAASQ